MWLLCIIYLCKIEMSEKTVSIVADILFIFIY